MRCVAVADYRDDPSEGINVVSRVVVDDLRAAGHEVRVLHPERLLRGLFGLLAARPQMVLFTHGPGPRTVAVSRIIRAASRARVVWVATRPDLARCPGWLRGWRTAHVVLCNRRRPDLGAVAVDAEFVVQPIGIAPERIADDTGAPLLWPDLRRPGVPVAVHVGHLRRNRGLERLAEVKRRLGTRIEVVVQASPHFEPAEGLVEELVAAGVHVRRGFVASIAEVYRSADLYLFPASPELEGAIDLPLSVVEAMACRCPVIATEFGALPEALAHESGVTLVPAGRFVDAVEAWVGCDPALRERPRGLPPGLDAHRLARIVVECVND